MSTAIVTGSSAGIGRAIAIRLLRGGYGVTLNYSTNDERAAETLAECRHISPNVILVKADVSNATGASLLVQETAGHFGRVDVLVNNASRAIDGPALDMTEAAWSNVINVNMLGPLLCSQQAARQMLKQDSGGAILNIGASTGIRGRLNGINTCASKAGLMMMTQCLALEWGPAIRVNTIIPGLTLTDEATRRFGLDDPDTRRLREGSVPLRRLGQPDDVADAVVMMLTDEAKFITGQKIVIDGGQYMW